MLQCLDSYNTSFPDFDSMIDYHEDLSKNSRWEHKAVRELEVVPLDKNSPLSGDMTQFAPDVSEEAVSDTIENLGLALKVEDHYYPLRDTAFKSLVDRAKINGTALPKLKKPDLANVLNSCLALHTKAFALLLIRDEKVTATHSGDNRDYAVLPINELLKSIHEKLEERFPGYRYDSGYTDHCITSASWSLPNQRDDLLGAYQKVLDAQGKSALAAKLMPGIRFITSDTGMASAKVSALLLGMRHPIHIGGMLAVEHRRQTTIKEFSMNLDMMFAQFGDAVMQLERLTKIYLDYPVNTMTAVCKKLAMPKKAAMEAISMFDISIGGSTVTAHDIFMAMQEIIFIMRTEGASESKLLHLEESIARALTIRWQDYDLARPVSY